MSLNSDDNVIKFKLEALVVYLSHFFLFHIKWKHGDMSFPKQI